MAHIMPYQQRHHAKMTQHPQISGSNHHTGPQCRILALPTELRLMICSYMSLSPQYLNSIAWRSAYFTCRRLHEDIRKQLKPEQDLNNYTKKILPLLNHANHNLRIMIGPEHPVLHLICEVTLYLPGRNLYMWYCCRVYLSQLYMLYLDRVNVVLTGDNYLESGWEMYDAFQAEWFRGAVSKRQINCKRIAFTVEALTDREGGRNQSTIFLLTASRHEVSYVMEVLQNKEGHQTERVYSSETKFKRHEEDWDRPGVSLNTEDLHLMLSDGFY